MALGSGTLPQSMSEHAVAWPSEPYKGLEFFSSTDVPLFSQREDDIEDCAARIDDFTTRVLILHGLSGMGKSSFLRAGLIPRLEDPPGDGSRFHFLRDGAGAPYIIRTTDDPVSRLREALRITASADGRLPARTAHEIQDILKVPASADTVESRRRPGHPCAQIAGRKPGDADPGGRFRPGGRSPDPDEDRAGSGGQCGQEARLLLSAGGDLPTQSGFEDRHFIENRVLRAVLQFF